MSKTIFSVLVIAGLTLGFTPAKAQTTDLNVLWETLQSLLAQVLELQEQLRLVSEGSDNALTSTPVELRAGLTEGMTGEDIRAIQSLLATDPEIYPTGLVTGYYGSLTREALVRFQAKYDLAVTGTIDETTKVALETLLSETGEPASLVKTDVVWAKLDAKLTKQCTDSEPPNCWWVKKEEDSVKFTDYQQVKSTIIGEEKIIISEVDDDKDDEEDTDEEELDKEVTNDDGQDLIAPLVIKLTEGQTIKFVNNTIVSLLEVKDYDRLTGGEATLKISNSGGCPMTSDPECLGAPSYSNEIVLNESNSDGTNYVVEVLGLDYSMVLSGASSITLTIE